MTTLAKNEIECTISTPQFLGSKHKYKMFEQIGVFNKETLLFTTKTIGGHNVQFESIKQFESSTVGIIHTK